MGAHRSAGRAAVARKQAAEAVVVRQCFAQPQLSEQATAVGHVFRLGQRSGRDRHVMPGEHLAGPVVVAVGPGLRVGPQGVEQGIVGPLRKLLKRGR